MQRQTQLANDLWPLLLPRIQALVTGAASGSGGGSGSGAVNLAAHDLGGSLHRGTLRSDQAPQFLMQDGSRPLAGSLAVDAGVTIDGVDLSAHAADPDAHHARVTAGTGISVTGQQVGLAAGANYQFIGTGSGTTAGWRNVSELAGNGLTAATGVLAVGVANTGATGLSVEADAVRLTSNSNPGAAASVLASDASGYLSLVRLVLSDRLRASLIDTAAGALTLNPATDVLLQPASNLVKAQSGVALQAYNYASQTTGWRITQDGQGDFRYLFVDEMHAKSFIADLEQALAGGQIICKSVAVLGATFTAPAASGTATLRVRDLPSAPDMAVFQSGDIVRLRTFSRAGGGLTIADCWGAVTGYADQSDDTQTWTFTRSAAPNAGAMAAGTTIAPDAIVLDYGVSGNGFHEVNAIDGLYGANSPYWQVVTWSTHPATGQTVRARGGNLYGIFAQANEYGLYAGAGTANTDSYLRISNAAVRLNNVPLQLWNGANQTVNISSTGTDVWIGPSGSDKRLSWDGNTLSVTGQIYVSGGNAATLSNVTGALNLVRNSSFELDSDGDGLADNFGIYNDDGGAVPTYAQIVTNAERSTRAQRIIWGGTNGSSKGIWFSTGVHKANVPYMLTFWCRTYVNTTIGLAHNITPTKVGLTWPATTGVSAWQFYAIKCTWATENSDSWYITASYGAPLLNGWIDFDNIMVYEGDQIVPYQPSPNDVVGYGGLVNMPAAPGTTPGLYLTATNMGYYNGSAWKTWMASTGEFYFGGSTGASLRWNGSKLSGYDSGNTEQWYASASDGKLYAGGGRLELSRYGEKIYRDTYQYTASIPEPGYGSLPDTAPLAETTLEFRDYAATFYRAGAPYQYSYPGNALLRVYASSKHIVPTDNVGWWAHYIDGIIEMPAYTTAGDPGTYNRTLRLIAPSISLEGSARTASLRVTNSKIYSDQALQVRDIADANYQTLICNSLGNSAGTYYSGNQHTFLNAAGDAKQSVAAAALALYPDVWAGGIYTTTNANNYGYFDFSYGGVRSAYLYWSAAQFSLVSSNGRNITMEFNSGGKVGINRADPAYTLDVSGEARVTGTLRTDVALSLKPGAEPATSTTYAVLFVDSGDGDLYVKFPNGTKVRLAYN